MAGGNTDPFVLHFVCPTANADEPDCTLTRTDLPGLAGKGENAVLLTSAGDYLLATDRDERVLRTYTFDDRGVLQENSNNFVSAGGDLPVQLIASLRNSNWVVGLDSDGRMRRYMPTEPSADLVAAEPLNREMTVATVGEQHIIGRVRKSPDEEELYLVAIDESLLYVSREPKLLLRGRPASRVVVTPRDEHVAVTLGHGDNADTLVFRVPDGALVDRFSGEMVSGRDDMTELPGLRAVSPDGSHLAYKTAAGSLALRDVDTGSACLVRSASAGEVRMAGFSAHGLLFFEAQVSVGASAVLAWDASTRYLSALSEANDGFHLAAVPARTLADERPWAIGVSSGSYTALQGTAEPQPLGLQGAVFIPRDDTELWVLESERLDSGRRLGIRRLAPRVRDDASSLRFGEVEDAEHMEEGKPQDKLEVTIGGPQTACLSTGAPGSRGYQCDSGSDDRFFAGATANQGEDPVRPNSTQPEVPALPDLSCDGDGIPLGQLSADDDCRFEVRGCCFASKDQACRAADCDIDSCAEDRGEQVATVTCGVGVNKP